MTRLVVCTTVLLWLGGCAVLIYEPFSDTTTDKQGNRLLADTPRNWHDWFVAIEESRIWREVGRKELLAGPRRTWDEFWWGRIEQHANGGVEHWRKHVHYMVERRRQEGLPELDLWRGFVGPVERDLAREAAGEPRSGGWNARWLTRLEELSSLQPISGFEPTGLDLQCHIVGRRRELGLPELVGAKVACADDWESPAAGREVPEGEYHRRAETVLRPIIPAAWKSPETMFSDPQAQALGEAARRGRLSRIDRLVAAGADAGAVGVGNETLLFWAQRVRVFRRLLEHGADPNVVSVMGESAMHTAARTPNAGFLEAALAHGGDPNVRDPWGDTPLSAAPWHIWPRVLETLLHAPGVDLEAPNRYGTTVAMKVAGLRDDVLLALLERGADYNVRNAAGYNVLDRLAFHRPLMFPGTVAARNCDRVIDWLAERGVELPEPRVRLPHSPSAGWAEGR